MTSIPEFSVNINHKRLVCALDPMLALSAYGLPLLERLGDVMEVWVARELWHILDNTSFYLEQPESLFLNSAQEQGNAEKTQAIMQILLAWEQVRFNNDPTRQRCYWFGDSPLESFLPDNIEPDMLRRYEALSASLDKRLLDKNASFSLACRDIAALSVCLPTAFVLTFLPADSDDEIPTICRVLESSGISCQLIQHDILQQKESDLLRQVLIQSGLSKWVWFGLKLVVLHLVVPVAYHVNIQCVETLFPLDYGIDDLDTMSTDTQIDYWREARGFWYPL